MLTHTESKGLSEADIIAILTAVPEGDECGYCGLSESDGDFPMSLTSVGLLCEFCLQHPFGTSSMCLDVETHESLCDCATGVCD